MAEVVLINCQGKDIRARQEHLGLGYLKSYLAASGVETDIIDAQFFPLEAEEILRRVQDLNPTVVGFSIFFSNIAASLATIRLLRAAGFAGHICLGGHYATFQSQDLLPRYPEVDSIVMGEGEITLAALVERLHRGEDWRDLPGLAFHDPQGRTVQTAPRALIPHLECLPFPDRTCYQERLVKEEIANLTSSRGCYARCSFCSVSAFYQLGTGPAWRPRNPKSVVDEMEYLAGLGAKYLHFVDDNFMGPGRKGRDRALAIGKEISRRGLKVTFDLDCRPCDVDKEVLATLQEVGLRRVGIGVESMLPRQLKLYRKGVTVAQNLEAIEILEELGLDYNAFFIPLEPYVTVEELLAVLDIMARIGLDHIIDDQILAWLVVLEGTSIIHDLRRDGLLYEAPPGVIDQEFTWGHPYVFRDRRVGALLPTFHLLQTNYLELRQQLQKLDSAGNVLLQHFLGQVEAALKQDKFDALRELLLSARKGDTGPVCEDLQGRMTTLKSQVSDLLEAYQNGQFNSFYTVHLPIGRQVLTYPPPEVTTLAAELLKYCASETA